MYILKKGTVLFFIALIAGLAAGFFRALQLAFAFNPETHLLEAHPSTTFLMGTVIVFVVVTIWLLTKTAKYEPGATKPPRGFWLASEFLASAMLLFSCIHGLLGLRERYHTIVLVFNLLGVLTAFSILIAAVYTFKGVLTASTGFYYTVPIFWCCFALVLDFWSHSANPVLLSFAFMMFALVFTALSVNAAAGHFFSRPRRRRAMAFCAFGFFFSVLSLSSFGFLQFYGELPAYLENTSATNELAKLLFMILHLGALFVAVSGRALRKPLAKGTAAAKENAAEKNDGEGDIYDEGFLTLNGQEYEQSYEQGYEQGYEQDYGQGYEQGFGQDYEQDYERE